MMGAAVEGIESEIGAGAEAIGIALPAGGAAALARYLALLDKWNRVYNLTAIRELPRMVTHHVLDSLAVLPALEQAVQSPDARLLDVGSGAGLPGIPLAIVRPRWGVALSEASHKKAAFLTHAAGELGLRNVEVALGRVEDYRPAHRFDVVISRAFADLAAFASASRAHLAPGGVLAAMKGVHPTEELAELDPEWRAWSTPIAVPELEAARHLILIRPRE